MDRYPGAKSHTASNFTDQSGRKRPNRASRRPQRLLENADAVGLTYALSFFTRSSCNPHGTQDGITTMLRAPRPRPVGTQAV